MEVLDQEDYDLVKTEYKEGDTVFFRKSNTFKSGIIVRHMLMDYCKVITVYYLINQIEGTYLIHDEEIVREVSSKELLIEWN